MLAAAPWVSCCLCAARLECRNHKAGADCVACWLFKRITRSLGGKAPNPDVPVTLINHMTSHIASRFVKGDQVSNPPTLMA